ncbi:MAG: winged helix-turn-helix transcriptional regulator [Planctomycetes bacterium]|nr:winged helix-turn-helix transcriptional regulator [Planctomycetota bacterium]
MTLDPVDVFRALGHPSRLQIAQALSEGDSCVSDLRQLVGASWSTVSQHLSVLKNAGVVDCSKQGNQVVYRLALPCVATFTQCLVAASKGQKVELRTCCS